MTALRAHTGSTHTPKKSRTALWTALSIAAFLLLVLLLSTIDDAHGNPWIETSLIGQLIVTIGGVSAVFGPSMLKNNRDVTVVKHEVKNDHKENMRVENDQRHAETKKWIGDLSRDIGGIRQELRDDRRMTHDTLQEHSERIHRVDENLRRHLNPETK